MKAGKIGPQIKNKCYEKLIKRQNQKQHDLHLVVTNYKCTYNSKQEINTTQNKLENNNAGQMLAQQMIILCNILIVEICNAKIKNNIQQKRKAENRVIKTIIFNAYNVLYSTVNTKNPEWLYQQIQKQYKGYIFKEFF
jgi:hypothetical protein